MEHNSGDGIYNDYEDQFTTLDRKSPIWMFWDKLEDNKTKCIICGSIQEIVGGTTTRIWEHTMKKHRQTQQAAFLRMKWNKEEEITRLKQNEIISEDMFMSVGGKYQCKACAKFENTKDDIMKHIKNHKL